MSGYSVSGRIPHRITSYNVCYTKLLRLLDEATAAAEAMTMCHRVGKSKSDTFFVSDRCHPQTIEVIRTRAEPLGITVLSYNFV